MVTEILLIVLSGVLVVYYFLKECRRPYKYPPGPPWLPFIGNLQELKALARQFGGQHLAFLQLAKKYNTDVVSVKLGKEHVICVCSYATVKKVLTSEAYEGRPDNFFFRLRSMGTRKGITGTDGDIWKEQRTFLVTHLRALGFGKSTMEEMIKEEIKHVIGKIETNLKGVDLGVVLAPSVLNILWTLTSGRSLRDNERVDILIQLLTVRSKAFDMSGGILNNHPWLRHIAPEKTGYNLLKKINSEIYELIMESIQEHKMNWTEGRNDDVIYSFLTEIKKREGKYSYFTDDQLVMVCLDIFIAGSTTTSNTINFAFLAMILHPEVQEKVYQCIIHSFGMNKNISYCDRQRMPYVEAVLLECQRFFPVVPICGPRRVLKTTMLDDYIITKNSTVLINLHSVHHDKAYWKDPGIFRPERFLNEHGKLISQDRILTFGLGRRRCLGDALAKTCIFLFFVDILRKYRIEADSIADKPAGIAVPGITMTPEKYKAKFIVRQ